ncbi:MAG: MotA/TolQ/ExbB proton channel family protein [Nitrospinota bacterium]
MIEFIAVYSSSLIGSNGSSLSVLGLISHTGWVGKFVLALLLGLSIASWGIMIHKYRLFQNINRDGALFNSYFHRRGIQIDTLYSYANKMKTCPIARLFLAGYIELAAQFRLTQDARAITSDELVLEKIDSIARALERASAEESTQLESYSFFLGATGSTAPFIGLFGTVWGVMEAFAGIGATGSASVAVVAPGISEALIATAAGIFTAVPAVIGYNYFVQESKTLSSQLDNFSLDFLTMIDKVYIKLS